jgi:hypothetical protein
MVAIYKGSYKSKVHLKKEMKILFQFSEYTYQNETYF